MRLSVRARAGSLAAALLLAAASAAGADAAPANNPHGRMLGTVLAVTSATAPARAATARAAATASPSTDLAYHGGPVMHADHAYSIYWEPAGHVSTAAYKDQIDGYLADVAADSGKTTNVYSSQTEYSDGAGPIRYSSTFAGRILDTRSYPAAGCAGPSGGACLSDAQLQVELQRLVAANSLPAGESAMYLIFTPPGVDTCGAGSCSFRDFCAYHSWVGSGPGALIYTDQPYVAGHPGCEPGNRPNSGDADPTLNVLSHEQNEAVTDPEGTGWFDANGDENGDKCSWNFGTPIGSTATGPYNQQIAGHAYLLQEEWSNVASGCVLTSSADEPPRVAIAGTPPPGGPAPGQPFAFSATATDPDGAIVSYGWDFGDGQTATGARVSHSYATSGTYAVTVTVTDGDGQRATDSQTVTVLDQPVAVVTASTESALAGTSVAFDGSASQAAGGAIASYAWVFAEADGTHSTASGARVAHVVLRPGTFEARLTVTDAAGSSGATSAFVTVRPRPPAAAITTSTAQQYANLPIAFDGTSSTGPDAAIAAYGWTFGDGQSSSGPSPSHAYARAGAYPVTLRVTDTAGQSAAVTRTVTVVNRPPVPIIALLPAALTAGQPAPLDGSASYAPDGTVVGYQWAFGDGQTASTAAPDHVYAAPGTYTVTLTATDNSGATATAARQIVVLAPAAPAPPGARPSPAPGPPAATAAPPSGALRLGRHQSLARLRASGLRFSVTCRAACRLAYAFVTPAHAAGPGHPAARLPERLLARGASALAAGGTRQLTARLSRSAITQLESMRRPRLVVTLTDPATARTSRLSATTTVS